MSLSEVNDNMVMPVAPMGNAGYSNGGFGFDGNSGWWILLLFLLIGNNGWGNGFGGYGNVGNDLYPWMNQSDQISGGFRDQMLNSSINNIQDGVNGLSNQLCNGFGNVQQSLCSGFAGVNATINGGFTNAEANANARQMANMNQAFTAQTAVTQGMNTIASNLQNCCCENRANIADLKYTVATENCADRAALSEGLRDVIANNTQQTQAILDKLCALELDNYKRENDNLRTQLNMASLNASQNAQTAQIIQDNNAQTAALINRIAPAPIPAYTVANPNGCYQGGCGCGSF